MPRQYPSGAMVTGTGHPESHPLTRFALRSGKPAKVYRAADRRAKAGCLACLVGGGTARFSVGGEDWCNDIERDRLFRMQLCLGRPEVRFTVRPNQSNNEDTCFSNALVWHSGHNRPDPPLRRRGHSEENPLFLKIRQL